ncbi:GDSL esterase/lipase At4g18970-like [Euphorbia lathyris]|uniref:GDSL esterase/lipase At4g18970-like n=1 Tax=Euphorbia lathyris TaxID=212925 RepID=UPI003314176A
MVKSVIGTPMVPCLFIFGDSLFDVGNNNNLTTKAKVNYPPYGIDFPGGVPTGRFSNGKIIPDYLAEILGFDHLIPPYTNATGEIILQGVNYASGSAGILTETGKHLGGNMDFDKQIENHKQTVVDMFKYLDFDNMKVTKQINKCIYAIGIGNNDYLNNYYLPDYYNSSKNYNLSQFADILIEKYSEHIKNLVRNGARKIAIFGLGNIGCVPFVLGRHLEDAIGNDWTGCIEKMNEGSAILNNKLVDLIKNLNQTLRYTKFVYVNSSGMSAGDPSAAGFTNFNAGCCKPRDDGQCMENEKTCPDRKKYVFWDSFHPTEISNQMSAGIIFNNSVPEITFPYDIHTLATVPS